MFSQNKYRDWYFSIIENAKKREIDPEEYYELHHIIPRGIGGNDNNSNLVFLSGREHFICHRLLLKFLIEPKHKRNMGFALTNFLRKNKNTPGRPHITSRVYESILKEYRSAFNKSCELIDPNNNIHSIENLRIFCKEKGLNYNYFRQKLYKNDDRRIILGINRGWRNLFRCYSSYRG